MVRTGDVRGSRYSWTETTATLSFEMERERETEREATLTSRLDAGKSPLFFLEPRRLSLSLSLSLESVRGEEKQVIRFKGFSVSDVNGGGGGGSVARLKCSFWGDRPSPRGNRDSNVW